MANSSPNDTDYIKAFEECFKNRKELLKTINDVDYNLSEIQDLQITINDLFLEKNEDLGMKCVSLLLKQIHCQYQLLIQIPHNGDLQILLNESSMDYGCLMNILSNKVGPNHKCNLKIPDAHTIVHISFDETSIPLEPINCQSLVEFADKFLELIMKKMEIHEAECEMDPCHRCKSFTDEDSDLDATPLLKYFGSCSITDEFQNDKTDTT